MLEGRRISWPRLGELCKLIHQAHHMHGSKPCLPSSSLMVTQA
jgi:hypothetical protein